ncbi:MAG TPA: hypothetical protein VFJ82_09795 [Longimicrobium sp.]|nr:hypothetical protein [Longimicrobium sp.]
MPLTITNQTDELVLLRYNSGVTHHLAPRTAVEVEPVEVKGNERIQSLAARRIIALDTGEAEAKDDKAAAGEDGGGRKGKR